MARHYERKIPVLDCGHDYTRKILNGRWKIAILLRIAKGISRPGELSRSIPQATRRVLDSQLAELLSQEIIIKEEFDEAVQHVEYRLTDLGRSLMPVIDIMGKWGEDHIDDLRKSVK
jgi:DNA-binding HxlR family transcriptional regulator